MLTRQSLPLNDFLSNLESFDIILMKGILVTSLEAQTLTSSTWSHVAMVVVAGDFGLPGIDPNARLIWEANTADTAIDLIYKTLKEGPQLVYLTDRIIHNYWKKFDGAYAARKLMYPRRQEMIDTLKKVVAETHDCVLPIVDGQYLELPYFLMGRFENKQSPEGTFFCSQLIAHTYQALGLMSNYYVDNSYVPADFTQDVDISLLNGAWLGKEIYLDTNTLPPQPTETSK